MNLHIFSSFPVHSFIKLFIISLWLFLGQLGITRASSRYEIDDLWTIWIKKWNFKKTSGCRLGSLSNAKLNIITKGFPDWSILGSNCQGCLKSSGRLLKDLSQKIKVEWTTYLWDRHKVPWLYLDTTFLPDQDIQPPTDELAPLVFVGFSDTKQDLGHF